MLIKPFVYLVWLALGFQNANPALDAPGGRVTFNSQSNGKASTRSDRNPGHSSSGWLGDGDGVVGRG